MKKKITISIILLIIIICFCWNGKTEFVKSKTIGGLYLIKNPPKNYSKTQKQFTQIDFYRYSWNTKYFLDHEEDPGGFLSEELSYYSEDNLATFIVSKCDNDTTKLVGELRLYNNFYQPDTIVYKCD